jgi:O-acetyl-ADP-ribose deacetylase (regulator of RNase III)
VPRLNPTDTKNPIHKDFPSNNDGRFEIVTKKGFHLSVSQGDITDGPVDVIVNSSDEYLGFLTGLPAALVSRGGRGIRDDAQAESRRKRKKPGDIIMTGPGRLYIALRLSTY